MEKRKSNVVVTIFAIITVVAIAMVVILRGMLNRNEGEEMDVSKYADRGITKAYMIPDESGTLTAYDVFVTVPGYKDNIETKIRIEKTGNELLDLQILTQNETPELGGKITEGSFLNQFKGKSLPIKLSGKTDGTGTGTGRSKGQSDGTKETAEDGNGSEGSLALSGTGNVEEEQDESAENNANSNLGEAVQRIDGVYRAEGEEFGGNKSQVTMVIENGEITELHWDSFDAEGNGKRALSLQGKYTMTEDGLLWADQADAVQKYVLEHQGLNGLTTNEEGKTDVVSGVSISIASFKELVKECLTQATAGSTGNNGNGTVDSENTEDNGNSTGNNTESNVEAAAEIDGISGATISSGAVVNAVQIAYEFVLEQGK